MVRLSLERAARSFRAGGREIRAVDGIDFALGEGELATIVGPSGSGKTTLLRVAGGLERLDSGSAARREGTRIGFMFQEPRLLGSLTVEANVAFGLGSRKAGRKGAARVREVLELLNLVDFRLAYPAQLSGGIAQRVALGRALVRDPELLLMDEPFSSLDAPLRRRLQDELLGILAARRTSLVFVTHDLVEAVYLGDRVLALRAGRIVRDEAIALARPRDPRSALFMDYLDSFAKTLGEDARMRSHELGCLTTFEEDSA